MYCTLCGHWSDNITVLLLNEDGGKKAVACPKCNAIVSEVVAIAVNDSLGAYGIQVEE